MVDIHCHVLPELDDGAESVSVSLKMLKSAAADSITTVVATPHFNIDEMTIADFLEQRRISYEKLKPYMDSAPNCPRILLGAEVEASYELLDCPDVKDLCIEGTNYMLLEIPRMGYPAWMESLVFNLQIHHSIVPVIAHPERSTWIRENPARLYRLCAGGALGQADAGGRTSDPLLLKLLSHNLVHFVASDAHNADTRPLNISKQLSAFRDDKNKKDYSKSLIENSEKFINDGAFYPSLKPVEFGRPKKKKTAGSLLKKLLKFLKEK